MNNTTDQEVFIGLFQSRPSKIFSICFSFLSTSLAVFLFYGIIWFERFGTDNKRTLINKLVSSQCWSAIQYFAICQNLDIIRYIVGPLPEWFCFLILVYKNSLKAQFIDSSILVQYVFVFWLKNPGGVNDDFWSCFINLWIIGFSYIFYFSKFLLNTQKPIVFFTCANINPEPFWSNTVQFTGHFEVFSIIISIILKLKLILFKKKQIPNEMSQRNIFMKNFTNNVINKNSLTSFKTSFLMLTIFASFTIVTGKINKMLPMEVNEFPSYIYVYIFQLKLLL